MAIIDRLKVRLPEASDKDNLLNEFTQTITDRLMLRIGMPNELPTVLESIVVDAAVKMYRRIYYEGLTKEGSEGLSSSFVDDILDEYEDDINAYNATQAEQGNGQRVVRFL